MGKKDAKLNAAKPKDAASKPKDAKAKDAKKSGKQQSDNRTLYIAAGVGVAIIATLIGSTLMLKRARRAARRRRASMTEEELAAEAAAEAEAAKHAWTPLQFAAAAAAIAALGVLLVLGYHLYRRVADAATRRREAAKQKAEAAALAAQKHQAHLENREARQRAAAAHRERDAAERAAQRAFEAELVEEIRRTKAEESQAAFEAAQRRLAEHQEAMREADRLDEIARAKSSLSGSLSKVFTGRDDDDDWDVGAFDFDAEEEDEGEVVVVGGGNDRDGDDGDDGDGDGEEERMAIENNPAARGCRVSLEALSMPDGAAARADALWVQLACARCAAPCELVLSGLFAREAEKRAWCDKCSSVLGASLRPTLATGDSNVLCHIDATNASVADVPRLSVVMECGRCFASLALPELQRGRRVHAGCRECHAPLHLQMGNVLLERLGGSGGGGGGGRGGGGGGGGKDDDDDELEQLLKKVRKKNAKQLETLGVVVGKPLPQKGACKHYKLSHRWLRFPCCARAYPCAVCHEASDCPAAAMGVWATRMICGKCSREMPYSDAPCAHCGNVFAHQSAAHWNGGGGCRDQQRLSTKDSRKHKGANVAGVKKTTSGKSQRVGAAGKKAVAAKVASRAE